MSIINLFPKTAFEMADVKPGQIFLSMFSGKTKLFCMKLENTPFGNNKALLLRLSGIDLFAETPIPFTIVGEELLTGPFHVLDGEMTLVPGCSYDDLELANDTDQSGTLYTDGTKAGVAVIRKSPIQRYFIAWFDGSVVEVNGPIDVPAFGSWNLLLKPMHADVHEMLVQRKPASKAETEW